MSLEQTIPEIGQTSSKEPLVFFINKKEFESQDQYITGLRLRELGQIPLDWVILLAIKKPWEDEIIENDSQIDLAREGKEHFIAHPPHEKVEVEISINDNPYKVKRGKHTVAELKNIGHVPVEYELEELIEEKLTPLDDNAVVHIKGGEEFFGHVRDGKSS